jgi:RHS repeat-associated protein
MGAVLAAPKYASLAASERSGSASGRAGLTLKNRVGGLGEYAPGNASGIEPQAAETASGCAGCSYEIVSGRTLWKVYGPDLNGRFGGLQGTGGLEAVILDADGTTTGVINDQFGNGVATVTGTGSGASVTWNMTRVGAYGPLPGIQAQTLTDVSQLAAATAWRSRRIDPTGFYWLGARYYEPTSGRFLSADPAGQAASPNLYDYAGGDPVNSFDPDGRAGLTVDANGNLVAPNNSYTPTIMCHGMNGAGYSGNSNQFVGLPTIPGVSPLAAEGFQNMANGIQQYGPSTVGKINLAVLGTVTGLGAGEAILGWYGAGSLGSGSTGTILYYLMNGALGTSLGIGTNATTQLIDNGFQVSKIDPGQFKVAGALGFGFGSLSGAFGVGSASIEANAAQLESQAAYTLSSGRYLDVTPWEMEAADILAAQTASNAAVRTGALWTVDTFVSPRVQDQLEDWLNEQFQSPREKSPSDNTTKDGSGVGNVTVQQDPTGKYSKPVSAY